MVTMETNRLTVRRFRSDDWAELQELAVQYQASDLARYEEPWPTSVEEIQGMAEWLAGRDDYFAVCLKATDQLIGFIAVDRRKEFDDQVHNLGYVFHPGHHGQGYATEGCRAAMGYVFGQLAADRIVTGTHPDNEPSVRLLTRLGLQGNDRGDFSMSREEWLALGPDTR
jgi:RimJ/RimL family protein N-acetyltransferase